jgi:hypothetical protein
MRAKTIHQGFQLVRAWALLNEPTDLVPRRILRGAWVCEAATAQKGWRIADQRKRII